ncbi:MAG: dTMP kinase [Desulfobacterota bacterium]|nr:dTMP kinase [Thermodesulfobacteriota bacterium]
MGLLIVFEGIEGCGKTTQIQLLADDLKRRHISVTVTREPGGTTIGEEIRSIFLRCENRDILPITELALITAARAQHIHQVIKPALNAGHVVLCDRFIDATRVYQGYAGGVPCDIIEQSHMLFCEGMQPDLTILLDCPASIGLDRSRTRNNECGIALREGRFEEKNISFHELVRQGYLRLAAEEPQRFVTVDATAPVTTVYSILLDSVVQRLQENGYAV